MHAHVSFGVAAVVMPSATLAPTQDLYVLLALALVSIERFISTHREKREERERESDARWVRAYVCAHSAALAAPFFFASLSLSLFAKKGEERSEKEERQGVRESLSES